MTLLGELLLGRRASSSATFHPSSNPATWWPRGEESVTGLQVTERNSLGHSAVYQAVQLIAGLHSILPCHVYERQGGDRREATDHPLWRLLHEEPNPESSWTQFDQAQMLNKLTFGNRYAEIEFTDGGRNGMRLWHLPSDLVTPRRAYKRPGGGVTLKAAEATPEDRRAGGTVVYEVRSGGASPVYIETARMLHVPDLSFDGLVGFSRVRTILESIAVGRARLLAMAAVYGNDSTPGGVLERPAEAPALSPIGERNLVAAFEATHGGVLRKGRLAVLQEGTIFKPVSFSPRDAMMIEAGQFSILEVAHAFNLSAHWLGHSVGSQPYANIESEWTALTVRTLMPHVRADEVEIRRKLLFASERGRYFAEYDLKGLLRGDSAARAAFYEKMVGLRVMTPNHVAQAENMPRVPANQGGDTYGSDRPAPQQVKRSEAGEFSDDRSAAVLRATLERLVSKEVAAMRKAAERATTLAELREQVGAFYRGHRGFVVKHGLGDQYANAYADRHASELGAVLRGEALLSTAVERLEERLREWEATAVPDEMTRLLAA